MKKKTLTTAAILYAALMIYLMFLGRVPWPVTGSYLETIQNNLNLVPFHTIVEFIETALYHPEDFRVFHAVVNLLGNVVMFVPLGFLICGLSESKSLWHTLWVAALILVVVEVTQLLTLYGSCDIDDLILNLLGAAIGHGACKLLIKE